LGIGFQRVGYWAIDRYEELGFFSAGSKEVIQRNLLFTACAVYAFVVVGDDPSYGDVAYIGQTGGTLYDRMDFYEKPIKPSGRNAINHSFIRRILEECKKQVDVYALVGMSSSYHGFHINLAKGLEPSLIYAFGPPWNEDWFPAHMWEPGKLR
jgi:hypothetical protein